MAPPHEENATWAAAVIATAAASNNPPAQPPAQLPAEPPLTFSQRAAEHARLSREAFLEYTSELLNTGVLQEGAYVELLRLGMNLYHAMPHVTGMPASQVPQEPPEHISSAAPALHVTRTSTGHRVEP